MGLKQNTKLKVQLFTSQKVMADSMFDMFASMKVGNDEEVEGYEYIDEYIRTRRQFDSSRPLAYKCDLEQIRSDCKDASSGYTIGELLYRIITGAHKGWFKVFFDGEKYRISVKRLTPFPSHLPVDKRVFGEFRCSSCRNKWKTGGSWKDKWQECRKCDEKAYPFSQNELSGARVVDNGEQRPHLVDKCQKCIEKGSICMPGKYFAVY